MTKPPYPFDKIDSVAAVVAKAGVSDQEALKAAYALANNEWMPHDVILIFGGNRAFTVRWQDDWTANWRRWLLQFAC